MSMAVQRGVVPWLVLGDQRRKALQERVAGIVRGWHQTWCGETCSDPAVSLGTEAAGAPRPGAVTVRAGHEGVTLICATASADLVRILAGVGSPQGALGTMLAPTEGLVLGVTEAVVRDLCRALLQAALPDMSCSFERERTAILNRELRKGSIAVTVALGKGIRSALDLLLAPEIIEALLGARPAAAGSDRLVSRLQATGEERVRVSALLGGATVSWRELKALCTGDVLVLEQPLENPCALLVGGQGPIAEAQLGMRAGALAVQITRIGSQSTPTRAPT
jgi:hypothetical protein